MGRSKSKISSPDVGMSRVVCSFASGAAEDDSFPQSADILDGYVTGNDADGYSGDGYGMALGSDNGVRGNGVYGVMRVSTGLYDVILMEQWVELIACQIQLESRVSKHLTLQVVSPGLENFTTTDLWSGRSVKRSKIRIRIVGSSGVDTDLVYEDRISVGLDLKKSSVGVKNRSRS